MNAWLLPSPASETTQSLGHTNKAAHCLSLSAFIQEVQRHEQGFKAKPSPLLVRLIRRRSLYRFQDGISSRAHVFCLCAQMFWDVSHFWEAVHQTCALVVHYLTGRVTRLCQRAVELWSNSILRRWPLRSGTQIRRPLSSQAFSSLSHTASVHKSTLSAAI